MGRTADARRGLTTIEAGAESHQRAGAGGVVTAAPINASACAYREPAPEGTSAGLGAIDADLGPSTRGGLASIAAITAAGGPADAVISSTPRVSGRRSGYM